METFTLSGALSISTVPRAETALVVVFDPRGPRRAYIDYFRLNPKPVDGKHPTSTSVKATYSTQILPKPIPNSSQTNPKFGPSTRRLVRVLDLGGLVSDAVADRNGQ